MKRLLILIILLLSIILTSCDMNILTNYSFNNFTFNNVDFANKDTVLIKIDGIWRECPNQTLDQKILNISLWVYNNIKYKHDVKKTYGTVGKKDYWNIPEETLENGYGDCEDFAILIIAIAYSQLHIKMSLACLTGHGVALWNDNIIECYNSDNNKPTTCNIDFLIGTKKFLNYVTYCETNNYTLIKVILFDEIIEKISERHLEIIE